MLDTNTVVAVCIPSLMVLAGILVNNRQLESLKNELKAGFDKSLIETKAELLKEIRKARGLSLRLLREHEEDLHRNR